MHIILTKDLFKKCSPQEEALCRKALKKYSDMPSTIRGAGLEQLHTKKELYSIRVKKEVRILLIKDPKQEDTFYAMRALPHHEYDKALRTNYDLNEIEIEVDEQDTPIMSEPTDIAFYYYHDQFITLNTSQQTACHAKLPLIVSGAPGSGKSYVALQMLRDYIDHHIEAAKANKEPIHIIYLTKSPELAKDMQETFHQQNNIPAEDLPFVNVSFKTFAECYQTTYQEKLLDVDEKEHCLAWITKQLEKRYESLLQIKLDSLKSPPSNAEKNRIKKELRATLFDQTENFYFEFRMLSYLAKNPSYYLSNSPGINDSLFYHDLETRKWLLDIFNDYIQSLNGRINTQFAEFKCDEKPNLIVVDEAQDMPLLCLQSAWIEANGNIAFFKGDHQDLFSSLNASHNIAKMCRETSNNGLSPSIIKLTTSCRSSNAIIRFANAILQAKYELNGGLSSTDELSFIDLNPDDSLTTSIQWVEEKNINLRHIQNDVRYAIIYNPLHQNEIIAYFGTLPINAYTIEESKGLEFDTAILWKPISGKKGDIFDKADSALPADFSYQLDNPKAARPKDKSSVNLDFNPVMNGFFVGGTRPRKELIIIDSGINRNLSRYFKNAAIQINSLNDPTLTAAPATASSSSQAEIVPDRKESYEDIERWAFQQLKKRRYPVIKRKIDDLKLQNRLSEAEKLNALLDAHLIEASQKARETAKPKKSQPVVATSSASSSLAPSISDQYPALLALCKKTLERAASKISATADETLITLLEVIFKKGMAGRKAAITALSEEYTFEYGADDKKTTLTFTGWKIVAVCSPNTWDKLLELAASTTNDKERLSEIFAKTNNIEATTWHLIAKYSPKAFDTALNLIVTNTPNGQERLAEALAQTDQFDRTGWHIIAKYCPLLLMKALTLVSEAPNGKQHLTNALFKADIHDISGWMIIARYATPDALDKALDLAIHTPTNKEHLSQNLSKTGPQGLTGWNLIARNAPGVLDKALNLAINTPADKQHLLAALAQMDFQGMTGWNVTARYAPLTLNKVLGLVINTPNDKQHLVEALAQPDHHGWTAWPMIQRFAPQVLSKALELATSTPEAVQRLAEALAIKTDQDWTGWHFFSRSPDALAKALDLVANLPNDKQQLADVLAISNKEGWTVWHLISEYAPDVLDKALDLIADIPNSNQHLSIAFAKPDVSGWTMWHMLAKYAPQSLAKALDLAVLTPNDKQCLAVALTTRNADNCTAWHLIADFAPDVLEKVLDLATDTLNGNQYLALALSETENATGWSGWHFIAEHAPHTLVKALKLAADFPKSKENLSIVFARPTKDDNWTAWHFMARYAPLALAEVLPLLTETPSDKQRLSNALAIEIGNGWTGWHLIAYHASSMFTTALNLSIETPDDKQRLANALNKKIENGHTGWDLVAQFAPAAFLPAKQLTADIGEPVLHNKQESFAPVMAAESSAPNIAASSLALDPHRLFSQPKEEPALASPSNSNSKG